MLLDKVTPSWNGLRDFVSSPAASSTPVFINAVLNETVECSKSRKIILVRMDVLMYCSSKVSAILYLKILGKIKHTSIKMLFLYSLKNQIYMNVYLIHKRVISSLPRQRVNHFKDLRWFYVG